MIIFPVITSESIITEKITPNTDSVESIIAVLVSDTFFWHKVWIKNEIAVLKKPKQLTPIYPIILELILNSPSSICVKKDSINTALNCIAVKTIGSSFSTYSLVKNIWHANPNAESNVNRSPILIDRPSSNDKIPIPIIVIMLPIIPDILTFLL